jgi:hypothetical protein
MSQTDRQGRFYIKGFGDCTQVMGYPEVTFLGFQAYPTT